MKDPYICDSVVFLLYEMLSMLQALGISFAGKLNTASQCAHDGTVLAQPIAHPAMSLACSAEGRISHRSETIPTTPHAQESAYLRLVQILSPLRIAAHVELKNVSPQSPDDIAFCLILCLSSIW